MFQLESHLPRVIGYSLVAFLSMLFAIAMAGCGTTSTERIELLSSTIDQAVETSAELDEQIPALRDRIAEAEELLEHAEGETAEKTKAFIADAREKLNKLLVIKSQLDEQLPGWKAELEEIKSRHDVGWLDEVEAVLGGAKAVAATLPATQASIVGAIAAGLGFVLTLIRGRKIKTGLVQTVAGVQHILDTTITHEKANLKAKLKQHQEPATRKLIDKIVARQVVA
jgi:hypothetical protein